MSSKYYDFTIRKSVHINLRKETHAAIRGLLFKYELSMQEVFEECAIRIIEGDDRFLTLLKELQEHKRNKIGKKFTQTDAESIFRAIETQNPLDADEGL